MCPEQVWHRGERGRRSRRRTSLKQTRSAGRNSEGQKGGEDSTLMWSHCCVLVCVCRGQGEGNKYQGALCNACLSAEHWTNIFATSYFPKASDSLCNLCKTFLKERSICSTYITSFYIIRLKQSFRAHVLLNVVQLKLLSFPHAET